MKSIISLLIVAVVTAAEPAKIGGDCDPELISKVCVDKARCDKATNKCVDETTCGTEVDSVQVECSDTRAPCDSTSYSAGCATGFRCATAPE